MDNLLGGVRFFYTRGGPYRDNFETFPWYQKHLRGFLAAHDKAVIWLLGNTAKIREAYLLFLPSVKDAVIKLLSEPLDKGGRFDAKLPTWERLLQKYQLKHLYGVGRLELEGELIGSQVLDPDLYGSPITLPSPITSKPNRMFTYAFEKATEKTVKTERGNSFQVEHWVCLHNVTVTSPLRPEYHSTQPELWIRRETIDSWLREGP